MKIIRTFNLYRKLRFLFLGLIAYFIGEGTVYAYIGPGAGFAFISSFFILFVTFFLAISTILFWPLRLIIRAFKKKRRTNMNHGIQRVVIVGLDGMDHELTATYMEEGKLPHLTQLSESGTFRKLRTTLPAMSPVAWSSFITGVDPSRHNIFDFLNRDLKTYLPELSSTKIERSLKSLSIGKYSIPLGKPYIKLLRKGKPFWNILSEYGIFSSILRVPMTFPPEKLNGVLLSGMCVPDLKGTQGTFTYYSSNGDPVGKRTGGVQIPVTIEGARISTYIPGPDNNIVTQDGEMRIPLDITLKGEDAAELRISSERFMLKKGSFSKWIQLTFKPVFNMKIRGVCRFFIKQINPFFEMYMTAIHIDPEKPALPISSPFSYSIYLSKMMGSYATLGLAEDTWALNERVIDEEMFLDQADIYHQEREEMFFNALDRTKKGLCACVFDMTDRIQHMFMRFQSVDHPANENDEKIEKYKSVIPDLYQRMDCLIGKIMKKMDDKTVLMVISDHGFKPFRRGVNLNTWLHKNGYLCLKDENETGGEWFQNVDWNKTRAYTFGLSGIYINEKGRESKGVVHSDKKKELNRELKERLQGLVDHERGETAIRNVFITSELFNGPYLESAPDLIIGYNEGYRASWGAAVGRADEEIFEDNTKSWSGDHCIDPELVPGIFFCNRKIISNAPHIKDIAPTVLNVFGAEVPSYMSGKSLIHSEREKRPE
ncbi:MAG: alkaline phosphatase family protein [Thermodesulfobacteriota bacterium]|nr:alkaline phosphatase family protein [Thermodesulfobacteriota bacterium]